MKFKKRNLTTDCERRWQTRMDTNWEGPQAKDAKDLKDRRDINDLNHQKANENEKIKPN